jgi:serine/threonine-protein kinase HipA
MNKCDVLIWNKKIGELYYINNKLKFSYIDGNIPFEISPLQLPSSIKIHDYTHKQDLKGLAGVFNDTLPDHYGEGVMNRYFASYHQEPNTIDRLLFLGNNTMGAITYEPSQNDKEAKEFKIKLDELYQDMKKLIKKDTKFNDNYANSDILYSLLKSASPAGGAKTKALIGFKNIHSPIFIGKRNSVLKDGYFNAIIKFNTNEYGSDANILITEHVYMTLAKSIGINIPYNTLTKEKHYVIKRFDNNNGEILHIHTLHGMIHSDFHVPRTVDYTEAFRVLIMLNVPYSDKEDMFKRMVFNFLFRNHDDHEKNISFTMNKKGIWRLSPAYDITYAYKQNGRFIGDHQLTFNGLVGNDVTIDTFKDIANTFEIKNYKTIIDEILKIRDTLNDALLKSGATKDFVSDIIKNVYQRGL